MNHEWYQLIDDQDAFYDKLPEPTITHFLDRLYHHKAAPFQAERWGDKGPSYIRVIPSIELLFPGVLYIHMIRDGRDSSLSARKKWGHLYWYYDIYYLLKNWVRNIEAGEKLGKPLGTHRFLEVRYEELVSNPEPVVRHICEFLGEPFEQAMLDHTGLAKQLVPKSGHYETEREVNTESVAGWKSKMTDFEKKVANIVAGPTLVQLGYELAPVGRFTFSERIRYWGLRLKFVASDCLRKILYASGWLKMSRIKKRK